MQLRDGFFIRSAGVLLVATGILIVVLFAQSSAPSTINIGVDTARPGAAIPSTLFGLFFEDINFAGDGGLYPELVKNRSFEFTEPLNGWSRSYSSEGQLIIRSEGGLNASNPHYLRLQSDSPAGISVTNSGFRGMGVEAGAEYIFSAWVRSPESGPKTLRATLLGPRGVKLGEAVLSGFSSQWKRYETTLKAAARESNARLQLSFDGEGYLDLDMVSLFPKNTWRNRPNGLRRDLVQMLADLKPGYLRFPGGCIVEGRRLALRYQWKNTVGDIHERRTIINRWNDENQDRLTPDYFQSFGLGFFEFFQLAEDIGASPLPVLNCGMACQFNSSELAPMSEIDQYVQDALDLIEFANGPVTSRWGALRAKMGHPEPFNLKMIGIGNEQWGKAYVERYKVFHQAIKSKYPDIKLVGGAGPFPEGKEFEYLWGEMRKLKADIVDEHYYRPPQWFLNNAGRYDRYDRNGPKVFAGDFAAHSAGTFLNNRSNWGVAMAEAAFMTGLERNADVVVMASYAPLFAHIDAYQWTPNLIWFDNLRVFGTPSYYVQKLFSTNRGDRILPVSIGGSPQNAQNGIYASASLDQKSGEAVVKIVNTNPTATLAQVSFGGAKVSGAPRTMVLAHDDLSAENSFDRPLAVAPVERTLGAGSGDMVPVTLPKYSLTVLRVPVR